MKWLLYSRKFKENLQKWLLMYIGVIGLLTGVITYSKYISSLQSNDAAKVAKFNVNIDYLGKCDGVAQTVACNYGKVRPTTPQFDFYFSVDTSELEVSTTLYTYIYVLKDFGGNFKLYESDSSLHQGNELSYTKLTSNDGKFNYFKITEDIAPSSGNKKFYKLVVNYNKNTDPEYVTETPYVNAVYVSYSAIQKK